MRVTEKTFVILAGLLFLPLTEAQAAVIPFGPISGTTNNNSRSWQNTVTGTFTDYALFSLTRFSVLSAGVTNAYASARLFIDDLTLSLYSGDVVGEGRLLASATFSAGASPPGVQNVDLSRLREGPGAYYLAVSGTTLDSPSYGGSLSVAVSPVPLPAAAPMFGAAVLALGLGGYGLQRRKKAAHA